jgi:hypothetical protein
MGPILSDISLNHSDQYRLENFLETISGQLAADIAHCQRNGEHDLAEMKLLTQSLAASIRQMLVSKGMMRRDPVVRPNVSRLGTASVRDALLPVDPVEAMALVIEGAEHAA